MASEERVAVIAVHGVADQKPGDTAQALCVLLQRNLPGQPVFSEAPLLIPVQALGLRSAGPAPGLLRQIAQLPHSGFARDRFDGAPAAPDEAFDLDFSAQMVGQHALSRGESTYNTQKMSATIAATQDGRPVQIDLFEMYWADLSRLGAGAWRILSEFYQIIFHLGSLGRHMVDLARARSPGSWLWRILSQTIAISEWALVGPIAMGNLGLLLIALLLTPAVLFETQAHIATTLLLGTYALAMTYLAWSLWENKPALGRLLGVAAFAAGMVALLSAYSQIPGWINSAGGTALAMVPAILVLSRIAADGLSARAASARLWGSVATLVTLAVFLPLSVRAAGTWQWPWQGYLETAVLAAAHAGEALFMMVVAGWVVLVIAQITYFAAGAAMHAMRLAHRDPVQQAAQHEGLRAVRTGMVAMMLSTSLFTIMTISLWTLLAQFRNVEVLKFTYIRPWIAYGPAESDRQIVSVSDFLGARLAASSDFFAPTVIALLWIGLALLLAFLPSVVAEVAPPRQESAAKRSVSMGTWLDTGLKMLGSIIALLSLIYVVVIVLFIVAISHPDPDSTVALAFRQISEQYLQWAGYLLAASATSLLAIGSALSKSLGRVRVILDVVLDIDNYFREHPRKSNPRARIYARYVALLRHIAHSPQAYDRVVIVAHSQGTVISTDLLRLIASPKHLPHLHMKDLPPVALVTAGSPLTQLYRARFPHLYRWIEPDNPQYQSLRTHFGVARWINIYRSGDYVGRWFWRKEPRFDAESAPHPVDAHRAEMCLGEGAHTHYFDESADALGKIVCQQLLPQNP
jgi:hypothetical protein